MTLLIQTALIVLMGAALQAGGAGEAKAKPDYQQMVRNTGWAWSEERANILYSFSQASSPYDVVVTRPHDQSFALRFKIMEGGRQVYDWWGHRYSVFVLRGERLYYVNFAVEAPGGEVVAVDLKAGKRLWKSPLRAVGNPPHFAYRNRVDIAANDDVVQVFGNESAGRYYELKDAKTGETVGHKIFGQSGKSSTNDHETGT